jgi:geranylgeranyldiphosphate transferase
MWLSDLWLKSNMEFLSFPNDMTGMIDPFHHALSQPTLLVAFAAFIILVLWDRLPSLPSTKKAMLIGKKQPHEITSLECPYSYILQLYGKYHWAPFVDKLSPTLKTNNPTKYQMILEIMDGIHLCLMLVDDVC